MGKEKPLNMPHRLKSSGSVVEFGRLFGEQNWHMFLLLHASARILLQPNILKMVPWLSSTEFHSVSVFPISDAWVLVVNHFPAGRRIGTDRRRGKELWGSYTKTLRRGRF